MFISVKNCLIDWKDLKRSCLPKRSDVRRYNQINEIFVKSKRVFVDFVGFFFFNFNELYSL